MVKLLILGGCFVFAQIALLDLMPNVNIWGCGTPDTTVVVSGVRVRGLE